MKISLGKLKEDINTDLSARDRVESTLEDFNADKEKISLLKDRKEIIKEMKNISGLLPELSGYMETVNHLLENMQTIKINHGGKFKIVSLNGTS